MEMIKKLLEFNLISVGEYHLRGYSVLFIALILLGTRGILWLIKKALYRPHHQYDEGTAFALYQIFKYIVLVISIGLILDTIGIQLTVLIAGSAALLVGVGLGLQQTFNDIVSGIILLSERSIKVGDILEVDKDVVMIQDIGLRTSKGLNRDDIAVIIPNSLITTSKVINWSHQSRKTRFWIDVGVAYESDVEKVIKILESSALKHRDISDPKLVEARLIDFGNSSLNFRLFFFSENIFRIERVKSDIRRIIQKDFNENGIKIPFPQMDVHLNS